MGKRLSAALALASLLLPLLLPAPPARAGMQSVRELEYAYLETSAAFFTAGERVEAAAAVPDASGLRFAFTLFYTPDHARTGQFERVGRQEESPSNAYSFTPENKGQYLLQAYVYDGEHRSLKLESEPFYCYGPEDLENPDTLPGRVKEIAAGMPAGGMETDYAKALWMHDVLTHGAEYDKTLSVHSPEGVLLRGAGVCESYALAYQMLLHEIGVESLYVTGTSRGVSHAWNLVKLGGEWTWVDVTWDDPVGGEEGYDYFGLTSALLSRDHDWSGGNLVPPPADSLKYNYLLNNGARPFADEKGLELLLKDALEKMEGTLRYTYHGPDPSFDAMDAVARWMEKNGGRHFVSGYQLSGSAYSGVLEVTYSPSEGYLPFADGEGFARAVGSLLASKATLVKVHYTGTDAGFDIGTFLGYWLSARAGEYEIISYRYTYTSAAAEITLDYGR